MTPKEPRSESLLAARIARAYPSLSAYSSATLAEELCRIERMQRRHAERCCSGADGGYVRHIANHARMNALKQAKANGTIAVLVEHDPEAEERAGKRVSLAIGRWLHRLTELRGGTAVSGAKIERQGDPRGRVLLLRLPGEMEASGV